ncbi:MAG: TIGR00282 family metallophosphoesterase [Thermodesulfobacteriota bacterium]
MADATTILFIGDVMGKPGRRAVKKLLPELMDIHCPDVVVANGENAAGGFGITPGVYEELLSLGVDVVTSGNHIWDKREIEDYIGGTDRLLRPANYPKEAPGGGMTVFECRSGVKVGVVNLSGRVFMAHIDCPFTVGSRAIERLREETPVILVDMHAEATSEKNAFACHFDGLVSAVIGTHTHVQTADERVLPLGTAYITDAGMTGPTDSVIGIEKEAALKRFLTQMPARFEVATGGVEFQGVVVKVGPDGKAESIERIKRPVG